MEPCEVTPYAPTEFVTSPRIHKELSKAEIDGLPGCRIIPRGEFDFSLIGFREIHLSYPTLRNVSPAREASVAKSRRATPGLGVANSCGLINRSSSLLKASREPVRPTTKRKLAIRSPVHGAPDKIAPDHG